MRILSVVTSFGAGGAETLARNLCREFVSQGHVCHLLAVSKAADIGNSAAFEMDFNRDLEASGISYGVLGNVTRRNPLIGAFRLRRSIREFRPDIIHIHNGHGLIFQAIGMIRLPTVYTHHNIRIGFPSDLFRIFDRFVTRYVAICATCQKLLNDHVRRPVRLIFNGVSPNVFSSAARQSPRRNASILSVGALTAQKDYPTLLRAAALCRDRLERAGRKVVFRIAGGGIEMPALRQIVEEEGLADHVELLGTRSDVPRLMQDADLVVNSSAYEGLPLTLIEAAMSAVPAVATDVGGNGEIVEQGGSGLLVPPGRPDLLADAIINVLTDEQMYLAFSRKARMLSQRFTIDACAAAHLELYGEVLAQSGRAHR